MSLRVLRIFLIIATIVALYAAYDQYGAADALRGEIAAELPQVDAMQTEMSQLSKLPTKTLRPPDEALEELIGRLIDDSDLLGSTVTIEMPQGGMKWEPVKHGVTKTKVGFTLTTDNSAGLAYCSMVWQLLERQPVKVTEAYIKHDKDMVKFTLRVELLALQGGG